MHWLATLKPKMAKDMKSFLGTMLYYWKFIDSYANYCSLLSPSTSKKAPREVQWMSEMEEAFHCFKSKLSNVTVLCVPSSADTLTLHTDASSLGVGAVLLVLREGKEVPTAFFSRQLIGVEKNYSTTEKEALPILAAVNHFLPLPYGKKFTVVTDHKPLTALMSSKTLKQAIAGLSVEIIRTLS